MRKGLGTPLYLGTAPPARVGVGTGVGVEGASGRRLQPCSGSAGNVGGPQVGPRERALLAGWGPGGPLSGRAGFGATPGGVRVRRLPPSRGFGVLPFLALGGSWLRVPTAALAGLWARGGGSRGQAVLRGVPGGAGGAVPAQGVGAGHRHGLQLVQEPRQGPIPAPRGPILGPFGAAHDGLRGGGDTWGKQGKTGKKNQQKDDMEWLQGDGRMGRGEGAWLGCPSGETPRSQNDPKMIPGCPPGTGVWPHREGPKILAGLMGQELDDIRTEVGTGGCGNVGDVGIVGHVGIWEDVEMGDNLGT